MAADRLSVSLAPFEHLVCLGIIHAGHAVRTCLAKILLQKGIGFGFIGAGEGIEMVIQETHQDGVPHIPVAEGAAQPESVGFSELVQRLIIRRNRTGQFGR